MARFFFQGMHQIVLLIQMNKIFDVVNIKIVHKNTLCSRFSTSVIARFSPMVRDFYILFLKKIFDQVG